MGAHPATALLAEAVEMSRKAAAMLAADQAWTASDGDLLRDLRLLGQLEAAAAMVGHELVRESQVRNLAAADGQSSTPAWLSRAMRLHPGEAKARVNDAAMLTGKASTTGTALRDGELNASQARAIAAGLGRIQAHASADEFSQAETFLLREGRFLHAGQITRLARHIEAVLDADGELERRERAFADRAFTISDLGNGRHRLRGTLTDEGAALLKAALDPLAAPRPATDGTKDPRSPGQRNADALVDLAAGYLRWGQDLPTSRGARPHVHVTVSIETLKGDTGHPFARTATGEDLDLPTVRRICCDAGLTPIVVDTLGEPLDVGREHRTVTPPIWAALVARDLGCVFPDCTRPAHWTQAHHIIHWVDGGETSLENSALVCDYHHDQIHHGGWQIRLGPHGHPELIPPSWVDPLRQPRHNAHWKLLRDGLRTDEPDHGP